MTGETSSRIRVGVGGWTYEPWRGSFYPAGLAQKRELEFASRQLSTIEINGTYYGSQKPESFAKWRAETPDGFVFAVKGPRFATNRKVLAELGASVERFFASGVLELKEKLGPINWQLLPTKRFQPEDFSRFLDLLPRSVEGCAIRHAVEVRHESFSSPDFVALARERGIAIVLAGDSEHPQIASFTAPFVYLRIMGTREADPAGYPDPALAAWAGRAQRLASGSLPQDLAAVGPPAADHAPRDVFLYVISGFKERNPAAATGIIKHLPIKHLPPTPAG